MSEVNNIIKNKLPETSLKRSDFYYDLPQELIAQTPAEKRDMSRLLVLNRKTGDTEHRFFRDITEYLREGDVLVINNTRVIPARLYGVKEETGVQMETLLLRLLDNGYWETILYPARRAKVGTEIVYGGGVLRGIVREIIDDGCRIMEFVYDKEKFTDIYAVLEKVGTMPLPPYITERSSDPSRYQTVYASINGSAAAPTAGLHFTPELIDKLKNAGVKIAPVLLHVGLGTFRPVKEDSFTDHIMHSEYIEVSEESAEIINNRKGRIIAVGTTSCRTLESASDDNGVVHPVRCDTGIFIYPGYKFKATDALITNFHLPESTLLMLVSAFSSRENVIAAYEEAIKEKYRFFSYGDAMFIC